MSSALPQSIVCERGHDDYSFAISHSFAFIFTKIDVRMEAKMPRQTFSRAIEGVETSETELNLLACHLCTCIHICPNTLVSCMHPCVYLRLCFLSHSYRRGSSASVKVTGGCTHLSEVMSHRLILPNQLLYKIEWQHPKLAMFAWRTGRHRISMHTWTHVKRLIQITCAYYD